MLARPMEQRFCEKVEITNSCWNWTGYIGNHGYGLIGVGIRGSGHYLTHRYIHELLVGEIPDGLVIDHLCRNRACVNPDHMEIVTRGENARRGLTKTHCKYGHKYNSENTRVCPSGQRKCISCEKARYIRSKNDS